ARRFCRSAVPALLLLPPLPPLSSPLPFPIPHSPSPIPHSCRHLLERPHERALRQLDLECVVLVRPRAGERRLSRGAERLGVRRLAREHAFGFARAPWLRGDATESDACAADRAVLHVEGYRGRGEREGEARAIAHL